MEQQVEPDPETVQADERDGLRAHDADRLPTPDEERLAERAADAIAPEEKAEVAEHYEEALRTGAEAKGEGRVE